MLDGRSRGARVRTVSEMAELTVSELATLRRLQETFSPLECDLDAATAQVAQALALLPVHKSDQLRSLLRLLETPLLSLLFAGRFSSFSALDQQGRTRLLVGMGASPLEKMRTGFQAFKRLCLSAAYSAVDARSQNPLWPIIGYPGPRGDRPTPPAGLPMTEPHETRLSADAVVVGSGAGGGVAAALLATSDKKVIVLEAGPPADARDYTQLEAASFANYYLDNGLAATDDLGVVTLAGACVGGGTTINWCTCLRIADKVAAQWRDASGGIDFSDLAAHYDSVAARLAIAPAADHNANNAVLVRGCSALGWHVGAQPKNTALCGEGGGYCGFGCSYGCKRSVQATYLRDAVGAGASIIAGARVVRVHLRHGEAAGVVADYRGRELHVEAPLVILAAGALRTPGILAASGVTSPHLGRHLKLHPTTALFAKFDESIETYKGAMQTAYSDQFGDLDDAYGAKLEVAPSHPGLAAFSLPWRSREQHAAAMRDSSHAAAVISLTRDRGEGRVDLTSGDVRYRVGEYDANHMLQGLNGAIEVAFAAGARVVRTLHQDILELDRDAATEARRREFAATILSRGVVPNRLAVFSAHQMGTCRMNRNPGNGVADERGAVHAVTGLYIADGSVFPLASGVNPMLTIMALAHRSASAILRT